MCTRPLKLKKNLTPLHKLFIGIIAPTQDPRSSKKKKKKKKKRNYRRELCISRPVGSLHSRTQGKIYESLGVSDANSQLTFIYLFASWFLGYYLWVVGSWCLLKGFTHTHTHTHTHTLLLKRKINKINQITTPNFTNFLIIR